MLLAAHIGTYVLFPLNWFTGSFANNASSEHVCILTTVRFCCWQSHIQLLRPRNQASNTGQTRLQLSPAPNGLLNDNSSPTSAAIRSCCRFCIARPAMQQLSKAIFSVMIALCIGSSMGATVLNMWEQCGGTSCPSGTCQDAEWKDSK